MDSKEGSPEGPTQGSIYSELRKINSKLKNEITSYNFLDGREAANDVRRHLISMPSYLILCADGVPPQKHKAFQGIQKCSKLSFEHF